MQDGKKGNTIVVLDFGAQYAQLIAISARKSGAYSVVKPYKIDLQEIRKIDPVGIILSGGPESVIMENAPMPDPGIFDLGIPVMGICYGHQLMAAMLGGRVRKSGREYGKCSVTLLGGTPFAQVGLPEENTVWMSHGDAVVQLPPGFGLIALSRACPIAGMINLQRRFVSFQFHPEVEHTNGGQKMMDFFVKEMCQAKCIWAMPDFINEEVDRIREIVGDSHVIGAVSGGVDSSAAAILMTKALGDRFTAIFVDNGLLRENEAAQVTDMLTSLGINFVHVDASRRFLSKLHGVVEPDQKRKVIGYEFIQVFEETANELAKKKGIGNIPFLVQGTIYPDVIESVPAHGGPTSKIKRHHNVGGLPERMGLKLIEPFRELFKAEVREIALQLGLPRDVCFRHPFPGPGLAIRCIGVAGVTEARLKILREADFIFTLELLEKDLYYKVGQAFVVLLSEMSVGVQGDEGTYEWVAALRCVDTTKFMTADWTRFSYDFLNHVGNRIIREVKGIGRVVYDISSKPPATIEWE